MKRSVAVGFSLVLASVSSWAQPATDPAAAILAAHAKIDADYRNSKLSPFTAVGVRYFEIGQTARIGADAAGIAFDPPAGMRSVIDLTWDGTAFTLTPVAGTHPVLYDKAGPDDVDTKNGRPVTGPVRLKDTDAVLLGRCYVESYGKAGNARLSDPESPARKAFTGLKWFPPDPSLQVKASFAALNDPKPIIIMTSRGLQKEYYRVGTLSFSIGATRLRLTALSPTPAPKQGDELFIPFRDATTGASTYSVGRYLTLTFNGADAGYVMDFNLATNPLCNYSPHYNCPIPPRENSLNVAIRAGEMTYPNPH